MNADPAYIDTSALAKWYLPEPGSDAFVDFIRRQDSAAISRLTAVELRCLLARRRRAGDIMVQHERDAWSTFEADILAGHLHVEALSDWHAITALHLLGQLQHLPLRTLDAFHLAIARSLAVGVVATADRVMARAAEALGMTAMMFSRGGA